MEPEEEESPGDFEMDGSPHYRDDCWCGAHHTVERTCSHCGGFVHSQGGYGFYGYECEDCHSQDNPVRD